MLARKTLKLPRARDLRSNSLEDIQNMLEKVFNELDKQYRLLWSDLNVIQLDDDGFIYFGNKDTLGTWRVGRIGADWVLEHQTTTVGTWVTVEFSDGA